jgi:hypothetical protein
MFHALKGASVQATENIVDISAKQIAYFAAECQTPEVERQSSTDWCSHCTE